MVSRSSPLRYAGAAACLVSAAAHLVVTEDHLEQARYLGALFVLLEVSCLALAVLLVRRDTVVVWALTGLTGALTIAAYVLSRSPGLPQVHDDIGRWTEPLGLVSVADETLMVALAAVVLGTVRARSVAPAPTGTRPAARPVAAGLAVLVAGMLATGGAVRAAADEGSPRHPGGHARTADSPGYWDAVGGDVPAGGRTRTYFLSADEVAWDYAPHGRNDITGEPFDEVADVFVKPGPDRIGSVYEKCLYRGYTDRTFRTRLARPASEAYLGLLGPVIRAEVGDTIRVVLRNTCRFPVSVHPHGVFYAKSSEGAPYDDGTRRGDKADDAVATGQRHTYLWKVPERAGPGPSDGSSVMWMYHSHTDEVADTYAGLMGPIVVTARGQARRDGSPDDVDREVFALFSVMDENQSPYLDRNRSRAEELGEGEGDESGDEEAFEESNLMHAVNGYVYGNMPMIDMRRGSHVRWYVMSMGTEVDLHTPHWHGNTVTVMGSRMDVVNLLPATMVVADMVPDDPGTWLFHCHVNDHILAGMLTRYRVLR